MERNLDPTDRILDDIDAQLLNEVKQRASNYAVCKLDVNDDSGSILNKSNLSNKKDYIETTLNYEPKNENNLQLSSEQKASKMSNGSLHQAYDADINILRRLLKDNFEEEPKEMEKQETLTQSGSNSEVLKVESFTPSYIPPSMEAKSVQKSVTFQEKPKEIEPENSLENTSTCSCNCEHELTQITLERDELKSWIRKGEASRTTIEERKELERALHTAKAQLFQDKKRTREKIEDLQEKFEESIHCYEEQIAEKDRIIEEMKQSKPASTVPETRNSSKSLEDETLIKTLQNQLNDRDTQLKKFTDICESQQNEIEKLNLKVKSHEEDILQSNTKVKSSNDALQNDFGALQHDFGALKKDNITLERNNQQLKHKHETLVFNFQQKLDDLQSENDKLNAENKFEVKRLGERERILNDQVAELTKHCQKYKEIGLSKELEMKEEQNAHNALIRKEKIAAEKKMEAMRSEISSLSAKNFRLEADIKEKYLECEKKLQNENGENKRKVESLQMDVADAITRLKDFEKESQHKDENLSQCMMEECHKLALLHHNMKLLSTRSRNPFHFNKNLPIPSKKALSQLQDIVELVCRSVNELICEVAQLRRETRQKQTNQITLKNGKDESDDELKQLREKLSFKDSQLHNLEVNMNQWKDLTAHRLAEKFQQELQLQVERKLSLKSNIESSDGDMLKVYPIASSTPTLPYSAKASNDTSTVQLLCHLQGRVKQLRVENDLLRSSSFIKGIGEN